MVKKYYNVNGVTALMFTENITDDDLSLVIENTESKFMAKFEGDKCIELTVLDTIFDCELPVSYGQYIVKFHDNKVTIMDHYKFKNQYKEIE